MKLLTLTFLFLGSLWTDLAFARSGPRSDGGTDELVERFVSLATSIIEKVPFESTDKTILETALDSVKIVSVRVLVDPRDRAAFG